MQDVNNDMDDLFRNAAEQYPLKTDGRDWDKVLAGLQDADAPATTVNNEQKRKRRALWLLLLLPLALMYAAYHHYSSANSKEEIAVNNNKTIGQEKEKNKTADNRKMKDDKVPEATEQANTVVSENKNKGTRKETNDDVQRSSNKTNHSFYQDNKVEVKAKKNTRQKGVFYSSHNNDKTAVEKEERNRETKTVFDKQINGKATAGTDNEQLVNNDKNNASARQPTEPDSRIQNTITDSVEKIATKQNSVATDTISKQKSDTDVAKEDNNSSKKSKDTIAAKQRKQGFYIGLSGGFDISNVKLQRIYKVGYSLNVSAGYHFSKRLSVETGIGLSKKNYYSDGKYFDKTKTGIPDRVKIYFTNGNCSMFEIPVNVKYDFALHKKSNLFITAGLSSYIMKKESYWYRGNYNMMRDYDTTRSYRNSGSNLFSVADFSIGYQLYINKKSALRIEPYLRLPLHGIGIANMPIMSTGISLGFTRKF